MQKMATNFSIDFEFYQSDVGKEHSDWKTLRDQDHFKG